MPTINRQPVFTSIPILSSVQLDPPIPNTLRQIDNKTDIYTCIHTYGCLIERITITAAAIPGEKVSGKIIYLVVYDNSNGVYSVYNSKYMDQITLTSSDELPKIEFTFEGGLLLKVGDRLAIAATANRSTNQDGDELNITIEGGGYDTP